MFVEKQFTRISVIILNEKTSASDSIILISRAISRMLSYDASREKITYNNWVFFFFFFLFVCFYLFCFVFLLKIFETN